MVPMTLLHDSRILPAAKLLYGRLATFCRRDPRYQPSQETLAAEICVHPRQVRNLLAQLRECGYVDWRRTKQGACRYRILERQPSATQETQERHCSAAKSGNGMPEGAALECRHKEVFKRGILKEGSSSSETVATVVEQPEPTTATAALISENQNREMWRGIEAAIWKRVDGGARQRIEASLGEQGFTVKHLVAYLKRYPISRKAKNPVGVLIAKAKTLSAELKAIDPDDPEPPDEFGERMRDEYPYPSADVCPVCKNTGRLDEPHPVRTTVKKWCWYPSCKAGQQAKDDDELAIANQLRTRPRDTWESRLIQCAAAGLDRKLIRSYVGLES